ncbi:MAG: phosphoribosylanthranilate isomerase [Dehalococcoidia bacterium]|nr:phosphoribosylanthranilate isomerase [Dehalococcoidia bacterium]
MTLIKICGITSVEDALAAARLDVQMIGLVFAESRRKVSPQQAAGISAAVKALSDHPAIVGVFVNENPQDINDVVHRCGLDLVQLSGDERMDACRSIEAPVIKALHISPDDRKEDIDYTVSANAPGKDRVIYLLDTMQEGKYGGTGQTFEWEIAREIASAYPVIIAGGLDPQNVSSLIGHVNPLGVDVSSGVETDGRKDIDKIRAFVQAVRSAGKPDTERIDFLQKYILKGDLNAS